ncbi:MAG: signal peptidase II [Thermoleophilia bacterium]|nr:signal peptidase II [Thermoleophilia bacterium]
MRLPSFFGYGRATLCAVVAIGLDQVTKWAAFAAATPGEVLNVAPGVTISQTRNDGIAFGIFAGRPDLVLGLMAVALAVLVWFYARHRGRPVLWLATGLLLGGAIGNALDRIVLGYVRDFVNLPGWPAFNVADMAITFGVVVLVLSSERNQRDGGGESDAVTQSSAEWRDGAGD